MVRITKKDSSFRKAFTLLEMIIVMVVLGIIANFGVEILVNTYENYILTSVQSRLQSQSESAIKQIANRLEYRIKLSVIAKKNDNTYVELVSAAPTMDATILEWVGVDREGWLGATTTPLWSGFIDIRSPLATNVVNGGSNLISPATDIDAVDSMIQKLGSSTISNAALYSIGADGSISDFGWDGEITDQSGYLHRIDASGTATEFAPHASATPFVSGNFISEFYQLTWTAYAVKFEDRDADGRNELWLYYDYQPWEGESYNSGTSQKLMDNVTTFAFKADGNVISIQVCVSDDDIFGEGAYSVCKEQTVF